MNVSGFKTRLIRQTLDLLFYTSAEVTVKVVVFFLNLGLVRDLDKALDCFDINQVNGSGLSSESLLVPLLQAGKHLELLMIISPTLGLAALAEE